MGCCCKKLVLGGVVAFVVGLLAYHCCHSPSMPVLEENPWWGHGKPTKEDTNIRPYKIQVSDKDLTDLRNRLALPERLTPGLENANFTYGFNPDTLKKITEYWRTKYQWRSREARLNKFPQFMTQIEGLDVHYIHVQPKNPDGKKVVPLLMIHGWPGSVVEFDEIIPMLTTSSPKRDIVFELICPSISGYGFSQASSKMGFGIPQTAQLFMKLMKRLGKDQFYIQGGDWGAVIVSAMATYYPKEILGVQSNMLALMHPMANLQYGLGAFLPSGFMMSSDYEEIFYPMGKFISMIFNEMGYAHLQGTKPDTVGSALNNSPIGLAAYILEKFSTWTHKDNPLKVDGGLLSKDFPISLDRLLDNISYYWFSRSISTSMRYYSENMPNLLLGTWKMDEVPTNVPAGFSHFKQELAYHPKNFASYKYKNIVTFKKHDVGGHFAAMEVPAVLADDIFEFVLKVEQMLEKEVKNEL